MSPSKNTIQVEGGGWWPNHPEEYQADTLWLYWDQSDHIIDVAAGEDERPVASIPVAGLASLLARGPV